GLEREAARLRVGDDRLRKLAPARSVEGERLAARPLDRLRELRRRLSARDEDDRRLGAERLEGLGDYADLLRAPALDAVGEQVAARGDERDRRDRGGERRGVRGRALARLEHLERARAALALGPRPQPRERGSDLALVRARDQIGGLDLIRHTSIECIPPAGG